MAKLQHCVYVLLSKADRHFYVGYTTDLKARLTSHFRGDSPSTAPRRPFTLVFCEYFGSKTDALRREQYLKTSPGRRTLRLMLEDGLRED